MRRRAHRGGGNRWLLCAPHQEPWTQIRGGESSFRLRLAVQQIFDIGSVLDVAIALNWDDFLRFGAELPLGSDTLVIYDSQHPIAPADDSTRLLWGRSGQPPPAGDRREPPASVLEALVVRR